MRQGSLRITMLGAWALMSLPAQVATLQTNVVRSAATRQQVMQMLSDASLYGSGAMSDAFYQGGRLRTYQCPGQRSPAPMVNDRRNLTFIHIPRTAGTTIEACTAESPEWDRWGRHAIELKGKQAFQGEKYQGEKYKHVNAGKNCYKHHVPPSLVGDYYQGKATFCVIRNPYDRMISEFHYPLGNGFGKMARAGLCNAKSLNNFTIEKLNFAKERPTINDCHLMPQSAYVFGWDANKGAVDRNARSCTHIIRQENLQEDFNGLMERSGYPHRLTEKGDPNTHAGPYWNCTHVTPDDFTPEARKVINEVWKVDFELLGFPMMH